MANYDGQVVINTKLDDQGLKKGITGLQNTSVSAIKKVKGVLAAAGIGLGVAAAVKGINNMVKSTIELTDRIDKQSQKIGISRQTFQEWDFILSQSGASVDGLQLGMKTLSTAMDEANDGTKEYSELFERLGINIHDTNGELKDQETIFNEVFKALSDMENQTERTAIASRLLGRSATELAPAMNGGAEAIEEMRSKAHDLGLVLDDETIDAGVRLTDTLDQMRRAVSAAKSRAIEPLMGVVDEMAGSFIDNAVPAIEEFLTKVFKVGLSVPPIFQFMKSVVTAVLDGISEALDGPWNKFKGFITDIINMPVVQNTIELALELAGELWSGLQKGVQSGDWSEFWSAAVGAAQFVIAIGATLKLAGMAGTVLWGAIQKSLGGAGFATAGLTTGVIAMLSVGLAVKEAMDTGEYDDLAADMIGAISAALIAGGLTKSKTAGALAFSIALNFNIGSSIANTISDAVKTYKGTDTEKIEIQDIIASPEGFFSKWGAFNSARKKLIKIWGIDTGREILEGLGIGLQDIEDIGEDSARDLLHAVMDELGIKSPSKEFEQIGEFSVQGLVNGLVSAFPELKGEAENMVEALEKIWANGEYKPPVPDGSSGSGGSSGGPDGEKPQARSDSIWGQIGKGWDGAQTELKGQVQSVSEFAQQQFEQIPATMGNAIGSSMQAVGNFFSTQKATLSKLDDNIEKTEKTIEQAYEDLEDAEEAYSDAVLSGDEQAIEDAKEQLDIQKDYIAGQEESLAGLKEEKKAVESGAKAWNDFAKVILGVLADELYGLGAQLAAQSIAALLTFNWGGAALAAAGSAAAFGAAIAVDSWAGSYADGGIIPQVSGLPNTGDRLTANVNPGELILNQAQQENLAAQLEAFSRITEILESMSFGGGGITVNMAGATINGLNEEKVGRAIYRNIKTLQHEGVLKAW